MAPPSRLEERKQQFKKGLSPDESRRKREVASVQLRKDRKEDSLQKRRRDVGGTSRASTHVGALPDPGLKAKLDTLSDDVEALQSDDPSVQLDATARVRKLLSIERNPPIAEVIAAGVIPRLVQFLHCYENHALVFEAAWALTNVSSGTSEHTRVVIDNGAVPVLVQLVVHANLEVREQAMWALGNIAGDSPRCRDLVLSYSMLPALLSQIGDGTKLTLLRNTTWTLSNLCRGKQPPRWELIAPALPVLVGLIAQSVDEEVLTDCCWSLSYMSEPAERVQSIIDAGALPYLVNLLGHQSQGVQSPALRTIGNVAAGNAAQTQAVLACDVLAQLHRLLGSSKKEIRKESCWTISNITAGSAEQVDAVCAAGLMPGLLEMLGCAEFEIKKEVAYAVCNACCGGSAAVANGIAQLGGVARLCDLLACPDAALLYAVLEALEAMLRAGSGEDGGPNRFALLVEEAGGIERIEGLQTHESAEIFQKAAHIIDHFFGEESDGAKEDSHMLPEVRADGFRFAPPAGSSARGAAT